MFYTENPVRIATDRIGGATKLSSKLCVATGTIHAWIKNRRVPDIDKARLIAEWAKMDVQQLRPTR